MPAVLSLVNAVVKVRRGDYMEAIANLGIGIALSVGLIRLGSVVRHSTGDLNADI